MPTFIASLNICQDSPNEVSLILLDDTGDSIANGSKGFFEQIFADLKIPAVPLSWEMQVCRSDYFSDFAGEDDWRDVWRTTWIAKVKTQEKIDKIAMIKDVFIESEAMDESWVYQKRITADSITNSLIISDFDSIQKLNKAADKINKIKLDPSDDYIEPRIKIDTVEIMDKYYRLQIDLGKVKPTFYSKGAADARKVQKICKDEGGTIHFEELIS
jgi:hypothetical protein